MAQRTAAQDEQQPFTLSAVDAQAVHTSATSATAEQ
jgi:acyl dehydratase